MSDYGADESRPEDRPEEGRGAGHGAQGPQGAPQPPPDQWYYGADGESSGPVGWETLRALASQGRIRRDDFVYSHETGQWVPADTVPGLFGGGVAPIGTAPPRGGAFEGMGYAAREQYAGFWIRFLAVFIDGLVLSVPMCVVWGIVAGVGAAATGGAAAAPRDVGPGMGVAFFFVYAFAYIFHIAATWLYFALFESSRWQATLGKRAVGIMVTDMAGRRLSFARATGRYFASWISGMILNIGYIIGAFTERKQTLHDMIAGTLVFYGSTG